MKNYTITVNGNIYDVTVEEGAASTAATSTSEKKVAPKAAPVVKATSGTQGGVKVNAPMPGKILKTVATVGQAIKKGEVIVILEAMKMENEIVAPQDGTVVSVNVQVGGSVEAGEVLATLN